MVKTRPWGHTEPSFNSQLCYILAMWPLLNYFTSPSLSFLNLMTHGVVRRINENAKPQSHHGRLSGLCYSWVAQRLCLLQQLAGRKGSKLAVSVSSFFLSHSLPHCHQSHYLKQVRRGTFNTINTNTCNNLFGSGSSTSAHCSYKINICQMLHHHTQEKFW